MRALRGWFAALAFVAVGAAAAFGDSTCSVAPGGRVILAADAAEPDVFLWDSRTRLVDYVAGRWDSSRAIFAHTELADAGTRAMVVACIAGIAHPKVGTAAEDAVGIKVLSGRHRGRYAWVLSSDIHPAKSGTPASPLNASKE